MRSCAEVAAALRRQVDIVHLIGVYVRLRKVGSWFIGMCPFHDGLTSSLNVDPAQRRFECVSCGVSGDVIRFLQQIEKISAHDAVKVLGQRYGIDVRELQDGCSGEH